MHYILLMMLALVIALPAHGQNGHIGDPGETPMPSFKREETKRTKSVKPTDLPSTKPTDLPGVKQPDTDAQKRTFNVGIKPQAEKKADAKADAKKRQKDVAEKAKLKSKKSAERTPAPAALNKSPKAQTELAMRFLRGDGVPKNEDLGLTLLKQAAGQDYGEAQYQLGLAHLNGWGVKKNSSRAFTWLRQAAEHGHTGAQIQLSTMYMLGQGARFDMAKAFMWLQIAANKGDADAARLRDDLKNTLAPDQLDKAQAMARRFRPKVMDDNGIGALPTPGYDPSNQQPNTTPY